MTAASAVGWVLLAGAVFCTAMELVQVVKRRLRREAERVADREADFARRMRDDQ